MRTSLLAASASLLFSANAFADWTNPGAAYRCAQSGKSFAIESVMESSTPDTPPNLNARRGFVALSKSRSVSCALGSSKVAVAFGVRPPQETGICGGVNQISIMSLLVNGRPVFSAPERFNFYCNNDDALHSVSITVSKNVPHIRICRAQWNWQLGYHQLRCEERDA